MGAQQSKDELLYQQVLFGNIEGIKALHRDGATLEWTDKEGRTPLILACMHPQLLPVVQLLIDLGANVNAYRPGSHAGTPLHHAVKRGLAQIVELLLSHGANPSVMNDDCQTTLDLARANGHRSIVRLIETRICLFSGWLREVYGPSLLEAIIPNWVSRKIWAVIVPCDFRNPNKPSKYELAIYSDLQAAQPNLVLHLWKFHVEEPVLHQTDPAIVIIDKSTKKRYKFLSVNEGDKQQLQLIYNACRGISQHNSYLPKEPIFTTMPNTSQVNPNSSAESSDVPQSTSEDVELAMAINASIQLAIAEGVPLHDARPANAVSDINGRGTFSVGATSSKLSTQVQLNEPNVPEAEQPMVMPSDPAPQPQAGQPDTPLVNVSVEEAPAASLPSAPPMVEDAFYVAAVQYPLIDSSPTDLVAPALEAKPSEFKEGTGETKVVSSISGSCVICLDAPVEGACVPCGHMAGCMSCLKEIREKKWGCPVCRAKIDQIIRLYAV